MAGRKQKYTAEEIADALRATKGMVTFAARRLNCKPQTIYNYAERYESVREELETQRGTIVDTAELKMIDAINRGEWPAIRFCLITLGKDRGYVERREMTGANGEPQQVNVTVRYA